MTITTPDKMPPVTVQVSSYGFGQWSLPLLHEIEGAHEQLLAGNLGEIVYHLPPELMTLLGQSQPEDGARFILAWINAGQDFEVAAFSASMSLYRTLLASEDAEDEEGNKGPYLRELAQAAMDLAEDADDICEAIVDNWTWGR